MKHQINLGEFITLLENVEDNKAEVRFDFCRFIPTTLDSYRGYYHQLALGWTDPKTHPNPVTVKHLVELCRDAIGKDFQGYKGGNYTMKHHTLLWVANYGECHDTAIVGVIDDGWRVVIETRFITW